MLIFIIIIIHPKWFTEDRVMINFVEVKLNWDIVPMIIDKDLRMRNIFQDIFFINKIIGIIFCQVINTAKLFQEIIFAIRINQLWKGAAANFSINTIIMTIEIVIRRIFVLFNVSLDNKEINNIIEAADWIKKYFILISLDWVVFSAITIITKDIDLISIKNHIMIHDFLDRKIMGVVTTNIVCVKFGYLIFKEFFYRWDMNPLALF